MLKPVIVSMAALLSSGMIAAPAPASQPAGDDDAVAVRDCPDPGDGAPLERRPAPHPRSDRSS